MARSTKAAFRCGLLGRSTVPGTPSDMPVIEQLQQYLQRLSARERRMVLGGAIVTLLLIVIAAVLPLQRSVHAAQHRVEKKRDDLVWLRSMAPQLSSLQTRLAPTLNESLIALVDRTARESG